MERHLCEVLRSTPSLSFRKKNTCLLRPRRLKQPYQLLFQSWHKGSFRETSHPSLPILQLSVCLKDILRGISIEWSIWDCAFLCLLHLLLVLKITQWSGEHYGLFTREDTSLTPFPWGINIHFAEVFGNNLDILSANNIIPFFADVVASKQIYFCSWS